ncbi:O-antigen polymerase [Paenibacillus macerans]|uniref:O-antigen ligase family protein n=1 Tax=Paenibacillus sp. FSL R5-0527 TaxID=2975321 RepID=UPI00097AAF42|nr:hypothetical protein BK140_14575 [Paenibacillus macerans]GJM69681.1 O-antigen polymerase [Paenibacillus macerans]
MNMPNYLRAPVSGEFWIAVFILSGFIKGQFTFLPVDLTQLLLAVTVLIAFTRMLRKPEISRGKLIPIMLYLVLFGYMCISLIYSPSKAYAFDKTLSFLLLTGWSFIGPILLVKDDQGLTRFLIGVIFVSCLMTFYGFQLFIEHLRAGEYIGQINAMGADYLSFGRTNGIAVLALICGFLYHPKLKAPAKTPAVILLLITIVSLCISGARMPLLSLAAVILLIAAISFRLKEGRLSARKGTGYLLAVLAIFSIILVPLMASGFLDTFIYRMSVLFTESGGGHSAEGRVDRFKIAFDMIRHAFWAGHGIGSFTIYYAGEDVSNYPHNIFFELWSELGFAGVVLFCAVASAAFAAAVKAVIGKARDHLTLVTSMTFLYLFLNANVSGDLNQNRVMFAYIGLCWVVSRFGENQNTSEER